MVEVGSPPLLRNPPKADKSLCWLDTIKPRNIPDMDACPDFFNRRGCPLQSVLTLNSIEGFVTAFSERHRIFHRRV